jgi:hypothetical protein
MYNSKQWQRSLDFTATSRKVFTETMLQHYLDPWGKPGKAATGLISRIYFAQHHYGPSSGSSSWDHMLPQHAVVSHILLHYGAQVEAKRLTPGRNNKRFFNSPIGPANKYTLMRPTKRPIRQPPLTAESRKSPTSTLPTSPTEMLANNRFRPTDEPDEPGDDLRANPSEDSGTLSSEPKAIAKATAQDSFGHRMTPLFSWKAQANINVCSHQATDVAGIRTPKTNKATSCYAGNATVMNTLRQDAPKKAKELAKAQAQVHLAQRGPQTLTPTLSVEVKRLKLVEQ